MMLPSAAVRNDNACCEHLRSCNVYRVYVTVDMFMSQADDVTLAVIIMQTDALAHCEDK